MDTTAPPSAAATISWPGLFSGILKESFRILSSHTRHFLSLSLLFLLPFSSLLLSLPIFLSPSSSQTLLLLSNPPPPHHHSSNPFLTTLLLITLLLFVSLLFISSSSISISHSSLHAFFGRPVRLLPSLCALRSAFLRLLLPLLALTLFTPLLLSSPLLLSLHFFPFLLLPLSFFSLLAFLLLLSFFSLALPVAALEPGSSFSFLLPLRRAAHLVTPIIPIPIIILFLFFPSMALILWTCGLREIHEGLLVMVVVRTVIGLAGMMLLMLYWMVSSAVMYLYCKAVRGELAEEIADEFAWEYVFLPFDEDKVPRVVSVVRR